MDIIDYQGVLSAEPDYLLNLNCEFLWSKLL